MTALIVIGGVAIGGWFRPLPDNKPLPASPAPIYTDQQVGEAKASVCAAFDKAHHALVVAGARNFGEDQVAKQVVAEGGWEALTTGSEYLLTTLAEEPATPPDLAQGIRKLAKLYQILALNFISDVSHSEQDSVLRNSDEATLTIERLCK
ncbi:MAG: hypothetical protein QJR12_03730 [Mycobacterium sp.]|uniref:hypothetical protein n=1 Tax=Mycobacterium sp. TaxID=1785 RepID=UPI00262C0A26|nr:hypothetical protein [Mycobacterium sp.]MDI3313416.1 hypothetical protein [Mycobacterium sp.]